MTTEHMTFVGVYREDDGTLTIEAVDAAGVVHSFRRAKLTGIEETKAGEADPCVEKITLKMEAIFPRGDDSEQ